MKAFFFDKFHQTLKWTCLKLTNIFRSFALAERQVSPNIQMHGCLKLTKIFRLQNFRSLTFFPREIWGNTPGSTSRLKSYHPPNLRKLQLKKSSEGAKFLMHRKFKVGPERIRSKWTSKPPFSRGLTNKHPNL